MYRWMFFRLIHLNALCVSGRAALVALALAATVAKSAENVTPDVERGRYLAAAGNCISCHTRPNGEPFAGGVQFQTPMGLIYSTNITPDAETGIGRWRELDLMRAMHEGIAPDGRRLFPAFPYTSFTKVTDDDVKAIHAFLKTLKPVRYSPPPNGIAFQQRWALRIWNSMNFEPVRYQPVASRSADWNRGAYLVEGLGHCSACHTPRNRFMALITTRGYAGGNFQARVADGKVRRWSGVNLTSSTTGLASWSVDDLAKYLKTGFNQHGGTFGPMNEVIVNSTSHLTSDDLRAIAVYVKSLPIQNIDVSKPPSVGQLETGKAIYIERCEKCHLATGRGGMFQGPRLVGNAVAQSDDSATLINIILYGAEVPETLGPFGGWETMKPYADILDDEEVAAVSNYVRNAWGNRGNVVTASDVAKQR